MNFPVSMDVSFELDTIEFLIPPESGPNNFIDIQFTHAIINGSLTVDEITLSGDIDNTNIQSIFRLSSDSYSIQFSLPSNVDHLTIRIQIPQGSVLPVDTTLDAHPAIDFTLIFGMPPEISTTLTLGSSSAITGNRIPITVVFGESVTGFTISDLMTTAGTISNFSGSGDTYTARLNLPTTGNGVAEVSIESRYY